MYNPPYLAVEALEIYYRIHATILKSLQRNPPTHHFQLYTKVEFYTFNTCNCILSFKSTLSTVYYGLFLHFTCGDVCSDIIADDAGYSGDEGKSVCRGAGFHSAAFE